MQYHPNPKDNPRFWLKVGWALLCISLGVIGFAALQVEVNPAAALIFVMMGPFALYGLALVSSRTARAWMSMPVERPSYRKRR